MKLYDRLQIWFETVYMQGDADIFVKEIYISRFPLWFRRLFLSMFYITIPLWILVWVYIVIIQIIFTMMFLILDGTVLFLSLGCETVEEFFVKHWN